MCNWVHDLKSVVKGELERLEHNLSIKKEELAQLEARKKDLEASDLSLTLLVSSSASGLSKSASAGPSAHKKKRKNKQKRHLGLPLQEGQEYYESYLTHLQYLHCLVLPILVSI